MNEARVVQRLIKSLKQQLPGAVVYKHNDAVTAGMPDVSVTYKRRVLWLEVKYEKLKSDKRQITQCKRLGRQDACFYFVGYYGRKNELWAYLARPKDVSNDSEVLRVDALGLFEEVVSEVVRHLTGGEDVHSLREDQHQAQAHPASRSRGAVALRGSDLFAYRGVQAGGMGRNAG